jgi:hypothetical protein
MPTEFAPPLSTAPTPEQLTDLTNRYELASTSSGPVQKPQDSQAVTQQQLLQMQADTIAAMKTMMEAMMATLRNPPQQPAPLPLPVEAVEAEIVPQDGTFPPTATKKKD